VLLEDRDSAGAAVSWQVLRYGRRHLGSESSIAASLIGERVHEQGDLHPLAAGRLR
jgi:hypothetical protein